MEIINWNPDFCKEIYYFEKLSGKYIVLLKKADFIVQYLDGHDRSFNVIFTQ